ncbi:MAG: DNA recombination protein RmuC [Candidatus Omnitrophota bacterium]
MTLLTVLTAVMLLAFVGLGIFIFSHFAKGLSKIESSVNKKLDWITQQVDSRLRDNSQSLQNASVDLGSKLESAVKAVSDVHRHLGKLEESQRQIYELGKDITGLQDLLRAPKMRGGIGEFFLEDLLRQIMPQEYFSFQHEFKSRERVDAVIKFAQGLVPIDAKFPLENFRKYLQTEDEREKEGFRKQFITDVKNHIKSISEKYIKPEEGTFDFALMYIPAENVYYETIIKDEKATDGGLFQHALKMKVIPVSPNSFYAYLKVILLGLKGMAVEKSAMKILQNIGKLQGEFTRFYEDFTKIGRHLSNSKSSYDLAEKHLVRFNERLLQIDIPTQVPENTAKVTD